MLPTLLFVAQLTTSLRAMPHVTVAAIVLFRCLCTCLVAVLDYLFNGNTRTNQELGSLCLLVFGAIVYGMDDISFSRLGYFWLLVNSLFLVTAQMVEKYLIVKMNQTPEAIGVIQNTLSLPVVYVFSQFIEHETPVESLKNVSKNTMIMICLTGVFGFFLNLCYMNLSKFAEATSISLAGNTNKLISIAVSPFVFSQQMSTGQITGVALCVISVILYSNKKLLPKLLKYAKLGSLVSSSRFIGLLIMLIMTVCVVRPWNFSVPLDLGQNLRKQITSAPVYSDVMCMGDQNELNRWEYRTCLYSNVCYDSTEHNLLFYAPADEPTHIVLEDNGTITSFPENFATYGRSLGWSVTPDAKRKMNQVPISTIYQAMPPEYVKLNSKSAHHTVLTEAIVAENYGHWMTDNIITAFHMAFNFGLNGNDMQLLYVGRCDVKYSKSPEELSRCERLSKELSSLISKYPVITSRQGDKLFTNSRTGVSSRKIACFQKLVMGYNYFLNPERSPQYASGAMFRDFRKTAVSSMGLNVNPPQKHLVTVFVKNGRRRWMNTPDVEQYLEKSFPSTIFRLADPSKLSLREQVELVAQTTVLVTPCGGVSYSAFFLAPGSSLLLVDYYNVLDKVPAKMESKTWTHVSKVLVSKVL